MRQDNFDSLLQLWALRALHWKGTIYRFVRHDSFGDDDVAQALNLHAWVDKSDDDTVAKHNNSIRAALPTHLTADLIKKSKKRETETSNQKFDFDRKFLIAVMNNMLRLAEEDNASEERRGPPHFEQNCALLQKVYGLCDIETKILRLALLQHQDGLLTDAFSLCKTKTRWAHIQLLANVLDERPAAIDKALAPNSRLIRLKLIEACRNRTDFVFVSPEDELSRRICYGPCNLEDIFRDIASKASQPTLGYRHYPHLGKTLKPLRHYLRTALRSKTRGINLFLHGPSGTGKSELSRVLARELRASLYEISCENESGMPIRPDKRLDALVKAGEIMQRRRAILVFDEAEDVFRASSFLGRSLASERKGWTNRMLDRTH